ncbi:MAG: hypothetical protein WC365_08395 [Candidatus Babeliales bacterium]
MAEIKTGDCAGMLGRVVSYDGELDDVEIKLGDGMTYVHTCSENIEQ